MHLTLGKHFQTNIHTCSHRRKRCIHLTNYSVNKKSSKFVPNQAAATAAGGSGGDEGGAEDSESQGSKWSIRALREHVEREGRVQWSHVWSQVRAEVWGRMKCGTGIALSPKAPVDHTFSLLFCPPHTSNPPYIRMVPLLFPPGP